MTLKSAYLRAERERPSLGICSGKRPEPTLDEIRADLASSLSRVINVVIKDRYGLLGNTLNELTLVEMLRSFEGNLARVKGDVTIIAQELLDRMFTPTSK